MFAAGEALVLTQEQKQKFNFSCRALFHMKTTVCIKHFVNDCRIALEILHQCSKRVKAKSQKVLRTNFCVFIRMFAFIKVALS